MNAHELAARYQQAKLLYIMKEYHDALDILEELLLYAPNNASLLYGKAKCYAALGYREEARKVNDTLIGNQTGTSVCPQEVQTTVRQAVGH